jgi:hypothetical protein
LYSLLTSKLQMMLLSMTMLVKSMFRVNKSLLIPQYLTCDMVKNFHDKAWNILPHHILFPHGKQIYCEYSMMWHGIFLKIPSCSHELVHLLMWPYSHKPTHSPTRIVVTTTCWTSYWSWICSLSSYLFMNTYCNCC